jgi:hypothetical protein
MDPLEQTPAPDLPLEGAESRWTWELSLTKATLAVVLKLCWRPAVFSTLKMRTFPTGSNSGLRRKLSKVKIEHPLFCLVSPQSMPIPLVAYSSPGPIFVGVIGGRELKKDYGILLKDYHESEWWSEHCNLIDLMLVYSFPSAVTPINTMKSILEYVPLSK